MQEALKNLEAAKDAASLEKIARFNDDIARFQELRDKMAAQAAELRESLPTMQADIDAAQAKNDEAINRVSKLQEKLDNKLEELKAVEALGDEELAETIKQQIKSLHQEIVTAKARVDFCEMELREAQDRLKGRKDKLMTVSVMQRSIKPISTSSQPGEMRSSTIWKRRKRPMTTPAKHTKRQKLQQTRPPRPR